VSSSPLLTLLTGNRFVVTLLFSPFQVRCDALKQNCLSYRLKDKGPGIYISPRHLGYRETRTAAVYIIRSGVHTSTSRKLVTFKASYEMKKIYACFSLHSVIFQLPGQSSGHTVYKSSYLWSTLHFASRQAANFVVCACMRSPGMQSPVNASDCIHGVGST